MPRRALLNLLGVRRQIDEVPRSWLRSRPHQTDGR